MTSPSELLPDALAIQPSFQVADFPDRRLYDRAYATQIAMVQGVLHHAPTTAALRKGTQRFLHNPRMNSHRLLRRSALHAPMPWLAEPVVLSCEDSTLTRFDTDDAGRLRSANDRGYVVHLSFAALPGTGLPCGWLGAHVWTRGQVPVRAQDHRQRPPSERESSKWPQLRAQVHAVARAVGFTGRLISVNDREGDAWGSLTDALDNGHELLTRAAQDRRLVGGGTLYRHLRQTPRAADVTLTLHVRDAHGNVSTRQATIEVRWTRVSLRPPSHDPWMSPTTLSVVAIELYEAHPPPGVTRFHSRLLSTCQTKDLADVLDQVQWYSNRWAVEVGNDVVKNALDFEGLPLRNVTACERALALAGPVAAQVARWVALARQSPPPPVATVFEPATLRDLAQYGRFVGVKVPAVWTVPGVVRVLGRMGGGDVRPNRPAGWRVVLRGWQRFEEFRALRTFFEEEARADTTRLQAKHDEPKGGP